MPDDRSQTTPPSPHDRNYWFLRYDAAAAEIERLRAALEEVQDVIEAARDEAIAYEHGDAVGKRRAGKIITEWEARVRELVPGIWSGSWVGKPDVTP